MTRDEALRHASALLEDRCIEDAALEAEVLLRHTLNIGRAGLYAERNAPMPLERERGYRADLSRRVAGLPLAYITGTREFFGLGFEVSPHVLIPRPETELLVEKAIERAHRYDAPVIVDVGTGCGTIAISLAVNLQQARIVATDISQSALNVARRNCERHRVLDRVTLLQGDLLKPLTEPVDFIVANLPYVRTADLPSVNTHGWEPRLALDGGPDGLDSIRRLCQQAGRALKPGGSLLLEIGAGQKEAAVEILASLQLSDHSGEGQNPEKEHAAHSQSNRSKRGDRDSRDSGRGKSLSISLCEREKNTNAPPLRKGETSRSDVGGFSPVTIRVFNDLAGIDRVVCVTIK